MFETILLIASQHYPIASQKKQIQGTFAAGRHAPDLQISLDEQEIRRVAREALVNPAGARRGPTSGRAKRSRGRQKPVAKRAITTMMATCMVPCTATTRT